MDGEHALIFDIFRGTTHDGAGQRNTVFFKGCPLSCKWCHNPESISAKPIVWWQERSCIGCLSCQGVCQNKALYADENGIHIDRSKCLSCGMCAKACPTESLCIVGQERELDDLVGEMLRYKPYFDQTGGGVTASGGEAMLQHGFVYNFFSKLHENGITTALDTCGFIKSEKYDEVLPVTDYVLYDLKIIDSTKHKEYCGQENGIILENAKHIVKSIADGTVKSEFWIRTPLIPNATDTEKNLRGIAKFVVHELGAENIARWELCSLNNSCIGKYERLGIKWQFKNEKPLTRTHVDFLRECAIEEGFPSSKIFVTGIINENT